MARQQEVPSSKREVSVPLLVPSVVETQRLRLRLWREGDEEAYIKQYSDDEMARFIGGPASAADSWRRMASLVGHWWLRGHGYWAVEERDTGDFVGAVGLWRPEGWPEVELGYWLAREAHGKGYATEAAAAARDSAFSDLGLETLVSFIHPDNEPSKRVAERLGAKPERTFELLSYGPHWIYRYPKPRED